MLSEYICYAGYLTVTFISVPGGDDTGDMGVACA
jgi:hypothetical protein